MKLCIIKKHFGETIQFDWTDSFWRKINPLKLDFHRIENKQNPDVELKLCYDSKSIFLFWKVSEIGIICNHQNHFDKVYEDSCVEFFVKPFGAKGYFNFEINCNGKILSYYITDWIRNSEGKLKEFSRISLDDIKNIKVKSSIESFTIESEKSEWYLLSEIPFSLLLMNSEISNLNFGEKWFGNFYKCADKSLLPHWSSWNPVKELNFHQPKDFGEIIFETN